MSSPKNELQLADPTGLITGLDPHQLQTELVDQFEKRLTAIRERRGEIHRPEDTHQLIRAVFAVGAHASEISRVISAFAKRAQQVLAEELNEAVGEQAGIPNGAMSVPYGDGTNIRIAPEYKTVRDIDLQSALVGVVTLVDDLWHEQGLRRADNPIGFALEVAERAITGLFGASAKVQITGINVLANELGQRGLDSVASVVRDAVVSERKVFDKVKVEQTTPKTRGRSAA